MGWWNANHTKVQILDYRQIASITLHDQLIIGYYFILQIIKLVIKKREAERQKTLVFFLPYSCTNL